MDVDMVAVERAAQEEWNRDASLRDEFLNDFSIFLAYRKAEAAGRLRILNNPTQRGAR
jgi:hypothetical protein